MNLKRSVVFTWMFFKVCLASVSGQSKIVRIFDRVSGQVIPYANLTYLRPDGEIGGLTSDINGNANIDTSLFNDSISISHVEYKTKTYSKLDLIKLTRIVLDKRETALDVVIVKSSKPIETVRYGKWKKVRTNHFAYYFTRSVGMVVRGLDTNFRYRAERIRVGVRPDINCSNGMYVRFLYVDSLGKPDKPIAEDIIIPPDQVTQDPVEFNLAKSGIFINQESFVIAIGLISYSDCRKKKTAFVSGTSLKQTVYDGETKFWTFNNSKKIWVPVNYLAVNMNPVIGVELKKIKK